MNTVCTVHRVKINLHSQLYMHSVRSTNVRMFRHIAGAIIREFVTIRPSKWSVAQAYTCARARTHTHIHTKIPLKHMNIQNKF